MYVIKRGNIPSAFCLDFGVSGFVLLQPLPQSCGPSATVETAEVIAVIMAAGFHSSQHEMSLSCPALAIAPVI